MRTHRRPWIPRRVVAPLSPSLLVTSLLVLVHIGHGSRRQGRVAVIAIVEVITAAAGGAASSCSGAGHSVCTCGCEHDLPRLRVSEAHNTDAST
jgi:hypothetical protein